MPPHRSDVEGADLGSGARSGIVVVAEHVVALHDEVHGDRYDDLIAGANCNPDDEPTAGVAWVMLCGGW